MQVMEIGTEESGMNLAGQCKIPLDIARYPFKIVSQWGVSHAFCLVFIGYLASIAEIPPFVGRGGIVPPLCMLSKGGALKKGEGGIAPNCPCCDTNSPIARNGGGDR